MCISEEEVELLVVVLSLMRPQRKILFSDFFFLLDSVEGKCIIKPPLTFFSPSETQCKHLGENSCLPLWCHKLNGVIPPALLGAQTQAKVSPIIKEKYLLCYTMHIPHSGSTLAAKRQLPAGLVKEPVLTGLFDPFQLKS